MHSTNIEKGVAFEKKPLEEVKDINEFIEKLKRCKASFDVKVDFKEGDIVVWKEGLKNKKIPDYGDLGIIIKILDTPIVDNEDVSSTYYNENLDLQIGFIASSGEFITFIHDSRRFKKHIQ